MRKSIFIILFALLNILSARAYDFEVNGIYYKCISEWSDKVMVTYKVTPTQAPVSRTDYTGSVVIPSSVWSEGSSSPHYVAAIGTRAFYRCTGLTSVTIPGGLMTSIGYAAFYGCTGLTSVTIPESVTTIDALAFFGCTGLTSVAIPEGVTSIGDNAFSGCCGLTSVEWNAVDCQDASRSDDRPFNSDYGCRENITSITFGNQVEHIPAYLCYEMNKLTSVTIPESVTTIGRLAFYDCSGLTSVISLAETPPSCSGSVFSVHDTLLVPRGCKAAYQEAEEWKEFAVIEEIPCLVTLLVNDATMGVVIGDGEHAFGAEVTLTAIPNEGYHFVKWNDGNTDNPRTLTVTQDTTLTAEFAINTYTVTVNVNDAAMGSVTDGNEYAHGAQVTLEAVPNPGYHFVKWNDENTDNPRTLTVTQDTTLTAVFAINTFMVSVSANDPAWGSVSQSGEGTYDSASSVTITATPDEGYRFIKWTKGEAVFSTQADTTFMVTENLELTANFEKRPDDAETFTVSLSVNNLEWGIVSQLGDGTYEKDGSATIIAAPKTGYRFVNWTKKDGAEFSKEAVHSFTVTESLELTANFEKQPDDVANEGRQDDNFRVYVQGRTILLSEDRGLVQVYNMAGQCVYNGHATSIPVPQEGVYIVRVGARSYKMIVR